MKQGLKNSFNAMLSVLLSIGLFLSLSSVAFAANSEQNEAQSLWQKAITYNRHFLSSRSGNEIYELSFTEKLGEKLLSDGTLEEQFSYTTLSLFNTVGEKINLNGIQNRASTNNSTTEEGITVAGTINYTSRWNDMYKNTEFKVLNVVTSVIRGSTAGAYPLYGDTLLWFDLATSDSNYVYKQFTCQSAPISQSFTMTSTNTNYYTSTVSYLGINAQSCVTLSSGTQIVQNTPLWLGSV